MLNSLIVGALVSLTGAADADSTRIVAPDSVAFDSAVGAAHALPTSRPSAPRSLRPGSNTLPKSSRIDTTRSDSSSAPAVSRDSIRSLVPVTHMQYDSIRSQNPRSFSLGWSGKRSHNTLLIRPDSLDGRSTAERSSRDSNPGFPGGRLGFGFVDGWYLVEAGLQLGPTASRFEVQLGYGFRRDLTKTTDGPNSNRLNVSGNEFLLHLVWYSLPMGPFELYGLVGPEIGIITSDWSRTQDSYSTGWPVLLISHHSREYRTGLDLGLGVCLSTPTGFGIRTGIEVTPGWSVERFRGSEGEGVVRTTRFDYREPTWMVGGYWVF